MSKQLTLKDLAQQEKPRIFKKIEDFEAININNEISERTCMTKEGKEFTIKELSLYNKDTDEVDRVRIPQTVIWGLQALLRHDPNLKYFRVIKTGEGMNTRYTVLPVNEVLQKMDMSSINFISYDEFVLMEKNLDEVITLFAKSRKNSNTQDAEVLKKLHQIRKNMINYKFKYLI